MPTAYCVTGRCSGGHLVGADPSAGGQGPASYGVFTRRRVLGTLAAAGAAGAGGLRRSAMASAQPVAGFLAACAAGTLPAVSFIDPRFEDEGSGTSGDDHPHADIRVGQSFINEIYQAITSSPAWERTVFVINYDEWGGFFDHVAPATAPDASPANGLRGFRVPALVISPLARRGTVAHRTYDHASALKIIAWRWGLP